MPKKNAADLRVENQLLRKSKTTEGIVSVVNNLIKWGGLSFLGYCFYLSIAALAGKSTMADIGINFLGQVTVSETLAWVMGGSGIGYGYYQRKLRRDVIEQSSETIKKREQEKDPGRSSSQLTPRGTTPEEG